MDNLPNELIELIALNFTSCDDLINFKYSCNAIKYALETEKMKKRFIYIYNNYICWLSHEFLNDSYNDVSSAEYTYYSDVDEEY